MKARRQEGAEARKAARPDLPPMDLMRRMLDKFEEAVETRWAYRHARDADDSRACAAVRDKIDAALSPEAFSVEVQKIVAMGIDGHDFARHKLPPGASSPSASP
jgi:hypothetical protein